MKRAFTLIELLVAIGVVAILASILLPVFTKAGERGRRTVCACQLKQLGLAMDVYLSDADDRFPPAAVTSVIAVTYGWRPSVMECLSGYVSDQRLWRCPSDIGEIYLRDISGFHKRTPPFWTPSFGGASYIYPGNHNGCGSIGRRVRSRMAAPAHTPIFWELRPWHGDYSPDEEGDESPAKVNIGYADGHVSQGTLKSVRNECLTATSPHSK